MTTSPSITVGSDSVRIKSLQDYVILWVMLYIYTTRKSVQTLLVAFKFAYEIESVVHVFKHLCT